MPETTKLHPKQPVAAALASRAAVRPALRQGGAFALGLAGGWAVLYGALLPFGLGLTLGLPADCFAACAAGAALSILFHGFGRFHWTASACSAPWGRPWPPDGSGPAGSARHFWPGAGRWCWEVSALRWARRGRLHAGVLLRGRCPAGGRLRLCAAALPARKSPVFGTLLGRFFRGGGAGRAALRAPSDPRGSGLCHGGCCPLLPRAGKARAGLCCFHRSRALRRRPFPCPGGGGALLRHGGSGPAGPRAAG